VLFAGLANRAAGEAGGQRRVSHSLLRQRDPDAWRATFEVEHPAIYRYVAGRLGGGAEAEDVTSQVFAEAWEHASTFDDHGLPVRAWLFGIARNVVNNHRRRLLKRPPALTLEAYDGRSDDPALDAERLDLVKAISKLDASWADVIVFRFVHGLSLHETAAALGLSVDAVKGKQARALAQLRASLSEGN